jgi:hypothetical protein
VLTSFRSRRATCRPVAKVVAGCGFAYLDAARARDCRYASRDLASVALE